MLHRFIFVNLSKGEIIVPLPQGRSEAVRYSSFGSLSTDHDPGELLLGLQIDGASTPNTLACDIYALLSGRSLSCRISQFGSNEVFLTCRGSPTTSSSISRLFSAVVYLPPRFYRAD